MRLVITQPGCTQLPSLYPVHCHCHCTLEAATTKGTLWYACSFISCKMLLNGRKRRRKKVKGQKHRWHIQLICPDVCVYVHSFLSLGPEEKRCQLWSSARCSHPRFKRETLLSASLCRLDWPSVSYQQNWQLAFVPSTTYLGRDIVGYFCFSRVRCNCFINDYVFWCSGLSEPAALGSLDQFSSTWICLV